jgi:hypothetical protein
MQQISRDKFDRFPRATTEFTLCVLDRYGLRDHWPARPTLTPPIRFLYIGSRFCSTLPSDPTSRRRPCASLSLHLYQVVKRTFTSKLSNMLGVPKKPGRQLAPWRKKGRATRYVKSRAPPFFAFSQLPLSACSFVRRFLLLSSNLEPQISNLQQPC